MNYYGHYKIYLENVKIRFSNGFLFPSNLFLDFLSFPILDFVMSCGCSTPSRTLLFCFELPTVCVASNIDFLGGLITFEIVGILSYSQDLHCNLLYRCSYP